MSDDEYFNDPRLADAVEQARQLAEARRKLEALEALYSEWGDRPPFEPNRKLWTALGRILNGGAR